MALVEFRSITGGQTVDETTVGTEEWLLTATHFEVLQIKIAGPEKDQFRFGRLRFVRPRLHASVIAVIF